ncbi:MFS transporter [Chromobacterium sp. IIBBL 290-4]|uniref:MFS transporter n=1 Tax=Chromobacterium sp. IIBBL 290-4 TaxID=2953890 RepID=UPI0020B7F32F|nr:MFS transporter [Chromobacterium sp. IIBBL 290-4]UTH72430.1 MFS transporter [Chromobacterium sp. IIBBL 290-4]
MTNMTQARRMGQCILLLDNTLVSFGFYLAFPLISSHFVGQLHWPALWVGCALGGRQFCQQGLSWLGGGLADRFGAKPAILSGLVLRAASFALLAHAENIGALLASCLLAGVGGALFEPARGALLARLLPPSRRERFFAWLMTTENLSAAGGAWAGSLLLDWGFY